MTISFETAGPICFGLVIGWITYRTLRRNETPSISDIASVIAAVGGAGVISLVGKEHLDPYCVGLAIGFFGYFITSLFVGDAKASKWMMEDKE